MMHERKYVEFVGRQQELGLDGHFNTFRRGPKWLGLLQIGEVVGLVVVDKEAGFDGDVGVAIVSHLYNGPLDGMLAAYAHDNHGSSEPAILKGILAGVYGEDAVGDDENYTVVYLTRILLTPADSLLLELTARMSSHDTIGVNQRDAWLGAAATALRSVRDMDIVDEQFAMDKVG